MNVERGEMVTLLADVTLRESSNKRMKYLKSVATYYTPNRHTWEYVANVQSCGAHDERLISVNTAKIETPEHEYIGKVGQHIRLDSQRADQ